MPPFVVRSQEHGSGEEYDSASSTEAIPDHYVRRLWVQRTPVYPLNAAAETMITFTNKDSRDRTVTHSAVSRGKMWIVRSGGSGGTEIARLEWPGKSRPGKSSKVTMGTRTCPLKDLLKTSLFTPTRYFTAPDGIEYRWKQTLFGENMPAKVDGIIFTLSTKDFKHPVATTERLANRDGRYTDESYPLYIAERGMGMVDWIVATLLFLDETEDKDPFSSI